MKRLIQSIALTFLIGCATTGGWQSSSGKFLASSAIVEDTAMHGWAVLVMAGQTTPDEQARIRSLHEQYQNSMAIATNAYVLAIKINDVTVFTGPSNQLFATRSAVVNETTKQKK